MYSFFLFSIFFFFKQKTAYEMRISDWSSDVCSSDLNNTSRIRLAYFGGRPVVETEFAAFVDQTDLWSKIETAAAEIGAVVDVMDTRPRVEHYSPGPNRMPPPGSTPAPARPNISFRADHGPLKSQTAVQLAPNHE